MFCPNCGTKITQGGSFCPSCGARIRNPAEPVKMEPAAALPEAPTPHEEPHELPLEMITPVKDPGTDKPQEDQSGPDNPFVMNEERGLIKYILFCIITCSIYGFYTIYSIARDVNLACEEDGEHTTGLVKYILFTIITCGIYNLYWHYKFLNRIQGNSRRYGYEVKSVGNMDLGAGFLVLFIAGIFLSWACGIGLVIQCYEIYLIFQNLNAMAKCYNARMSAKDNITGEVLREN